MLVSPGVHQIKVPMPANPNIPDGGLRYTLVYLVQVPQGWVTVDAGLNTDEGFHAYKDYLAQEGIDSSDIKLLFITHGHTDHSGLAMRLRELTGAPLAIHRLDAGDQRNPLMRRDPELVRQWMLRQGVPAEDLAQNPMMGMGGRPNGQQGNTPWQQPVLEVDRVLEGGEELLPGSGLMTVWTPGHSPGHLCVYDKGRRLLFSGDHILPVITPHVSLFPGQEEGDPLGTFIQGHQDILKLDVVEGHPAHEFSMPDLKKRVREIIEHHRHRLDEITATLNDGPKTAWQVASKITWNVAPWPQLNFGTRRAAMLETLSHLQYMALRDEIRKVETEGLVTYARAE